MLEVGPNGILIYVNGILGVSALRPEPMPSRYAFMRT